MSRRDHTPVGQDLSAGSNRRDVLLSAGGLAAVAAVGRTVRDRELVPAVQLSGSIDNIGTFEFIALSFGASNSSNVFAGPGGGGGAGKVSLQNLSFTKYTDKSSPKLFLATATGQHFPKATFAFIGRRGQPVITYELHEVLVTSFSAGESNTQDRPTENISLDFARFQLTVDGASAGWDVVTGHSI